MAKIRPRKKHTEESSEQGVETSDAHDQQDESPPLVYVPVTRSRSLMLKREASQLAWYRRRLQLPPSCSNEVDPEIENQSKEAQLSTGAHVEHEDYKTEAFLTTSTNLNDDKEPEQPGDLEHSAQSTQIPCVCSCGMLWQGVEQKLKVLDEKSEEANSVLAQRMLDLETRYAEGSHGSQVLIREIEALRGVLEPNATKWDSLYQESPDLVTKLEKGEYASDAKKNLGVGFGSDEFAEPVELQLGIVELIDLNSLPVMLDNEATHCLPLGSEELAVPKAVVLKNVEEESRSWEENPGTGLDSDKAENPLVQELQQSAVPLMFKEQTRESEFCSKEMELCAPSTVDEYPGTGSYTDESLNPVDLQNAVRSVKMLVTRFAKHFSESLNRRMDSKLKLESLLKTWYSRVYFTRQQHMLIYALKASINNGLFKGFEKEDFASGITLYFDQITRSKIYTEYFRKRRIDEDQLFSDFKRKKLCWLIKRFELFSDEVLVEWENSHLGSEFNSMVTSIWLLHKAAFAFVTPASILRIPETVELDEEYMELVDIDEDQQSVPRVGFMVMPGFRLGKSVFKAQIYPSMP